MVVPVDTESYSYRFYKTLNNDVKLKSNEYNEWDIVFDDTTNDWINVSGFDSLSNACLIAIMTRFNEESFLPPYEDFGCRVHELVKANKSRNVQYRMELFITETLQSIRRVRKVNWVQVTDNPDGEDYNYQVNFSVSGVIDEDYTTEDLDLSTIEVKFYL